MSEETTSHSDFYFEPNKPPDVVLEKKSNKRVLKIRFKTKDDVIEFTRRTGVDVMHGKNNFISYPQIDIFG